MRYGIEQRFTVILETDWVVPCQNLRYAIEFFYIQPITVHEKLRQNKQYPMRNERVRERESWCPEVTVNPQAPHTRGNSIGAGESFEASEPLTTGALPFRERDGHRLQFVYRVNRRDFGTEKFVARPEVVVGIIRGRADAERSRADRLVSKIEYRSGAKGCVVG